MKRRDFLRRSSLTLTALGAGDLVLSSIAQRYQQVLAAPTQRKLALLIGINQYRSAPLYGCVTDVELQRELLIHRFGFQASDILTLTDQQATREAIATAFVEHFIEQARSGDVAVFHFSGYGGKVAFDTPSGALQKSLVTVSDPIVQSDGAIVDDLLIDTLLLLLRSLPTDRVTTILDASYTNAEQSLQGNLRLRSRPNLAGTQPSEAERAFQESLLSQASVDRARLAALRRSGQLPGVVLAAAGTDQLATEAKWSGFSAGLFTYALTQQLWQSTPATALRVSLRRASEQIEQLVNQAQQPLLSGQKSQERPLTPYHSPPIPAWGADGVVVALEDSGKVARLWLGGLSAAVLEQYEPNSLLVLLDEPSTDSAIDRLPKLELQLLSRDGLLAKAKLNPPLTETAPAVLVGRFVRERVRVLPRNVGLTIALDRNLARIERVDAISAFSAVPRVTAAIAGEQAADYLFSKTQTVQPTQVAALPSAALPAMLAANPTVAPSSYALFSPGRNAIPSTAGEGGEAVKIAVRRLLPKLQTLLAVKLLNLTVNDGSSQLAVRATLELLAPATRPLIQRETPPFAQRSPNPSAALLAAETGGLASLAIGSHIQFRLENQSDAPLYFLLLSLDTNGDLTLLYSPPNQATTATAIAPAPPDTLETTPEKKASASEPTTPPARPSSSIAPHETLTLPQVSTSFQWLLSGPTGLAETYLLCSRAPFSQTALLLSVVPRSPSDVPSLRTLANPLDVAQSVLQDLHQAGDTQPANHTPQRGGSTPDTFVLDMRTWASLRFVYQIV